MRSFPNIDRSAFRPGEYVGYANGNVYRIRHILLARGRRGWRLTPLHIGPLTNGWVQEDRRTLAEISLFLSGLENAK
jgi:hypothetical protein